MEDLFFFGTFGAAVAAALLLGAAYSRSRRRLARLEDRLLSASALDPELESRVDELSRRVAQLARGQEFLQQVLSGRRRLPHGGKPSEVTPS